jgi:glutamyl-tRNA synthetase
MKNLKEKIKAYGLKNAVEHEGKAVEGAIISALFHEGLKREEVKEVIKDVKAEVSRINKLSAEQQKKEYEKFEEDISKRKERVGLPELPDTEKVIMRFRPAPSGPMHIGHIITGLPSSLYAKKYKGKFYIIVDDTDPETALKEAYDNIKRDCDWIFGNVHEYINSSDRMLRYYEIAVELIKKQKAYVCTCAQKKFKIYSERMKDCPCRNFSVKDNLERWGVMLKKSKEGDAVLRFKSDMKHPNPAMRDFPLARISLKEHVKQGKKYRVWPLMNLVVAIDDMDMNMTHVIRGKEHRDNAERQKLIFEAFDKKFPWTFFMGRIKFEDLVISKRKITAMINAGDIENEEDARIPTIASIRKRGYLPEAFAMMAEHRGLTEVDKVMKSEDFFRLLDNFNKEAVEEAKKR